MREMRGMGVGMQGMKKGMRESGWEIGNVVNVGNGSGMRRIGVSTRGIELK